MQAQDILIALGLGEGKDWEFKSAKGGLPLSLWETYSAMANTDGGYIVLGVKQQDDSYVVIGLHDPAQARRDFWNTLNNRGKISANLLRDEDVFPREVQGKQLVVIRVPRASRYERPVYVGQNPLLGTYRRSYEGDYHCTEKEVGRMLADRSEEPWDSQILENFGLEDFDQANMSQYRQLFSARAPAHPWLSEGLMGFLKKLGAWREDRDTKRQGPTVAGMLMFGRGEAIRDPEAVPDFHLDYRERLSDDPEVRWTDRLTGDGTWEANVFQFFQRVLPKLTADLKIPFRLDPDLFRRDDTIVHEALREAVVNALIHADYRGQGGIVIEKYRSRFEISNPGTLLLPLEQVLKGGLSECRNKTLQTMFMMMGRGEKAGSGIDTIWRGWRSQQWRTPRIQETTRPDRVVLTLPMVSLLPEESLARLGQVFGPRKLRVLGPLEVQALVTADVEGEVSNARMQEISSEHPADITRLLQGLARGEFLVQTGRKRGAVYRLPFDETSVRRDSLHSRAGSAHKPGDSAHKPPSQEELNWLRAIAAPARQHRRLPKREMQDIIMHLCEGRYLTAARLGELMGRNPDGLRNRFLKPMLLSGVLVRRYAGEANRPDQAYTAKRGGARGAEGN